MVFQSNPMDFICLYNPSQAYTVKHVNKLPMADRNIVHVEHYSMSSTRMSPFPIMESGGY